MIKSNKIGIWMNHSTAYLTEFTEEPMSTTTIIDDFSHQDKVDTLRKSEHTMQQREQHNSANYYKKIGDVILNYTNVVLFGPTNAKLELVNSLKGNHRFDNIKFDVETTDKMTENEQQVFVKKYFQNHI